MRGPASLTWSQRAGTGTSLSDVSLPSLCRDARRPEQEALQALHGRLLRQLRRRQVRCAARRQPLGQRACVPPGPRTHAGSRGWFPHASRVPPLTWARMRAATVFRRTYPGGGLHAPVLWGAVGAPCGVAQGPCFQQEEGLVSFGGSRTGVRNGGTWPQAPRWPQGTAPPGNV